MKLLKKTVFSTSYLLKLHRRKHRKIARRGLVSVVCFHNISKEESVIYPNLHPKQFEKIIEFIAAKYLVISLGDLKNTQNSDRPRLVISFDDGDKSFLKNALPVLKKYKLPSVHNIIVKCADGGFAPWTHRFNAVIQRIFAMRRSEAINFQGRQFRLGKDRRSTVTKGNALFQQLIAVGSEERDNLISALEGKFELENAEFMNWRDLEVCRDNNVEIGCHSYSHDILTTIRDESHLLEEIVNAGKRIEEKLGNRIRTYAFPNGHYNGKIYSMCRRAGYANLLTSEEGLYRGHSDLIPRISLNSNKYEELIFKLYNLHGFLTH